jgi:hypothetical protein
MLMAGGAAAGAAAIGIGAPIGRSEASGNSAARSQPKTARYRSRPDLEPSLIEVTGPAGQPGAGYLCVTPSGPMMVDNAGEPVWIQPVPHASTNLRVQQFQGRPVLTWWQGTISEYGIGLTGEYVVLDGSYRQLMTVGGRNGLAADLHEFIIDGHGVAYFTAYRHLEQDLRSVGGPKKGAVLASAVQGVDLATGALVFDWNSLDHIGLDESYEKYATASKNHFPYDPVHLNSIDFTPDGKLLFSARNTWTLYKVDPSTGDIEWRLGGKRSDFALGPGVRFAWQHDGRSHPGNVVTVFDDEGDPPEAKQSRGLVLSLNETAKKVTLVRQYLHPHKPVLAGAEGSVQLLPNGDVLVGWGLEPFYTEYRTDGTVVLDAEFATGESYRALRFPWTGTPPDQPAVAAERRHGRVTVYASWNGSTETASWEALGGPHPDLLQPVGAAPRTGFETPIPAQGPADYVAARALDSGGSILAVSRAIRA